MKSHCLFAAVFLLFGSCLVAFCQSSPASPAQYSFTISASQLWTDTGVDLSAGDTLTVTAEAKSGADPSCVPQGTSSSTDDKRLLSGAPAEALIAKLSNNTDPILVGSGGDLHTAAAGHLYLGLNQTAKSECAFSVKVTIAHDQTPDQAAAQPRNMKDQLSSAAKIWLTGQFGNSAPGNTMASNGFAENGNATAANSSTASAGSKAPTVTLDSDLYASTSMGSRDECTTISAISATW